REALVTYDIPLLGGDTIASTGSSTFGITAIGRATHHSKVLGVPGVRKPAHLADLELGKLILKETFDCLKPKA
ncbi:MAG: hypothetical protein AAGB04_27825, partial [Pseudomonadota bacterium]